MKFNKYYRFNEPFWFSGIYKISEYTWFRGYDCKPYYHAYVMVGPGQWGDYVGGKQAQLDKQLSFKECVKLCEEHAKKYTCTKQQLEQAEAGRKRWCEA